MTTQNHPNTSRQQELFRHLILLQLESASPRSLPIETLKQGIHLAGFEELPKQSLEKDLAYLADKGFIEEESPLLAPATKRYRLKAQGQDYLETHKLV